MKCICSVKIIEDGDCGAAGKDTNPDRIDSNMEKSGAVVDVSSHDITGGTLNNMRYLTRLIKAMSKYTILVSFAVTTTFVIFLLAASILFLCFDNPDESIVGLMVTTMIFCIDAVVNAACLVLQFEFSKKIYAKICFKCHRKCENRYTTQANKHHKDAQLIRLPSGEFGIQKSIGIGIDKQFSQPSIIGASSAGSSVRNEPKMAQASISIIGAQSVGVLDA